MTDYSTYAKTEYQHDLEYCKQFIFSFGSNYALGVRMFPRKIREATIIFYAFVRYADELVDNPDQEIPGQTHITIDEFISEWEHVLTHEPSAETHPTIRAVYWIFLHKNIPFNYIEDFLKAMKQDMDKARYTTYAELEHYMWGSASIVGHVMTFIVGYSEKKAFDDARALGEAMQLANFLRDVDEDYQDRNRIYLPQNDMFLFGVTEDMITSRLMTPQLYNLVQHYTQRTEQLFDQGISGIKQLHAGRFSIALASRMYRENIRILKKRDYNIFGSPIRLSIYQKIYVLLTTFVWYPYWLLKK